MFLKFSSYFYVLSAEEQENANNFRMDHHSKAYILSHIILRLLLISKYIGVEPESIEIYKNKYGKPFIKSSRLNFNI